MTGGSSRERGFSLPEIVVVLGLVASLAGLAGVAWQDRRDAVALPSAIRQVTQSLHLARLRAVTMGQNQRLLFTVGQGTYRLQQAIGSTWQDAEAPLSLPTGVTVTRCTATGGGVSFRPRGTAIHFGTITLGNRHGASRQVVVDMAGHVRTP